MTDKDAQTQTDVYFQLLDRRLVDEALNRAMLGFMARKGEPDNGPYVRDDMERVCGKDSSVMLLINEAELAIKAARLLERERCAKAAEIFGHPVVDAAGGRIVEETAKAIAAHIRSGKSQ